SCQPKARTAGLLVAALVALGGLAGSAAAAESSIMLASHHLTPGKRVVFAGTGWAPQTVLQLQLCGRNAVDGSADCVARAAATASADGQGHIDGTLLVRMPPRP